MRVDEIESPMMLRALFDDDLKPGTRLVYKGDFVVPVHSKFNKQKSPNGVDVYPLPGFRGDFPKAADEWIVTPGDKDAFYSIDYIKTGRTNKRTGKPLSDMVIIRCNKFADDFRIGLSREDTKIKFGLAAADSYGAAVPPSVEAKIWSESTMESGW